MDLFKWPICDHFEEDEIGFESSFVYDQVIRIHGGKNLIKE
jgi:hypothetical protein